MTEDNRYKNGKIYRIVCNETGKQYIGSTCMTLCKRIYKHKEGYTFYMRGKHNYVSSFVIIEKNNFNIVLIEEYPCENKHQLRSRERYWIENSICVNLTIPTRTKKENREAKYEEYQERDKKYYEENRERVLERQKKYYEDNRDDRQLYNKKYWEDNKQELHEKHKTYYNENKEYITLNKTDCPCGGRFGMSNKSNHEKTKKHQNYLSSLIINSSLPA